MQKTVTLIILVLKLNISIRIKIHDTVYAIGSPRRFTGKPTEGKITMLYNYIPPGLHELTDFTMQGIKVKYIETDAPVDKGKFWRWFIF